MGIDFAMWDDNVHSDTIVRRNVDTFSAAMHETRFVRAPEEPGVIETLGHMLTVVGDVVFNTATVLRNSMGLQSINKSMLDRHPSCDCAQQ